MEYDYGPLENMDNVQNLFATARGSTYAQHDDLSTTGYREPSNMLGTGKELQPPSQKTVFVPSDRAEDLARAFQNQTIATEMVPIRDEKGSGRMQVKATEPGESMWFGKFEKGKVLAEAPYTTTPKIGHAPLELFGSNQSPVGSKGRGVHFGSEITEVIPKPRIERSMGAVPLTGAPMGGGDLHKLNPQALLRAKGGMIDKPLAGTNKLI